MKKMSMSRRSVLKNMGAASIAGLTLGNQAMAMDSGRSATPKMFSLADLGATTKEEKNTILTKVVGSIAEEETHAFLRFHLYGYMGKNIVPFFSMNNYVIQRWRPVSPGTFELRHYEVGYFTEFDTDNAITHWKNPVTGKTVELEQFVLGPVPRMYTPDGVHAPGIAPQPLRMSIIGDRVFVPTQGIENFPNMFSPEEWPDLSSGPRVYWDSMYTFSASLKDVLDPKVTSAPAEIHLQNLTSWQPFLRLGQTEGRSMARAFGTNISGFDALDPKVRADFEKYTPKIFETDTWLESRFDSIEYYQKMVKERDEKKGAK